MASEADLPTSSQPRISVFQIENRWQLLLPLAIILEHAGIDSSVLSFYIQRWLGSLSFEEKVIVTMGAVFIAELWSVRSVVASMKT